MYFPQLLVYVQKSMIVIPAKARNQKIFINSSILDSQSSWE